MINWIPTEERTPNRAGFYLVTLKTYDETCRKVLGVTTSATWWRRERWMSFEDEDVIAWAEMPKPYTGGAE